MIVRTSKGHEYSAAWIHGPLMGTRELMMEITDGRKLSAIAAEFEGCEDVRAQRGEKDTEPITLYEGYTELVSIFRDKDAVRITLEKPKEE